MSCWLLLKRFAVEILDGVSVCWPRDCREQAHMGEKGLDDRGCNIGGHSDSAKYHDGFDLGEIYVETVSS